MNNRKKFLSLTAIFILSQVAWAQPSYNGQIEIYRAGRRDDTVGDPALDARTSNLLSTPDDIAEMIKNIPGPYSTLLKTIDFKKILGATQADQSQPASVNTHPAATAPKSEQKNRQKQEGQGQHLAEKDDSQEKKFKPYPNGAELYIKQMWQRQDPAVNINASDDQRK